MLGIRQLLQALSHGHRVIGNVRRLLVAPRPDFNHAAALFRTDPFDPSASELLLVRHIEQSVLETCRAEIRYQDFHVRRLLYIRDE